MNDGEKGSVRFSACKKGSFRLSMEGIDSPFCFQNDYFLFRLHKGIFHPLIRTPIGFKCRFRFCANHCEAEATPPPTSTCSHESLTVASSPRKQCVNV